MRKDVEFILRTAGFTKAEQADILIDYIQRPDDPNKASLCPIADYDVSS